MFLRAGDGSVSPRPLEEVDGLTGRGERLLKGVGDLWSSGTLSDVILRTQDGRSYAAHRAILAAASDYFLVMFTGDMTERDSEEISLKGVSSVGLAPLLEFVYTGEFNITEQNVLEIISVAAHLQIEFALPPCIRFMAKEIDVDNCVDIYNTAKIYQLKTADVGLDIEKVSFDYICNHFYLVTEAKHHLRLDSETLFLCLTGKTEEGTDIVRYGPEVELFHVILEWVKSNEDEMLLSAIRYPLMTLAELDEVDNILEKEDILSCRHLVEEARSYHSLSMHRQVHQARSDQLCLRNRPCVVTLARSCNGTDRGLRFFILSSPEGCPPPAAETKVLTWLQIPKLDHSIHENIRHGFNVISCEAVNGFLIICGLTEMNHLRCYMLDSRTFLWSPMAVMNVPRIDCPLVECDGDLFSLGGVKNGTKTEAEPDGRFSNVIERYSFKQGRWEIVGCMGECLANHGACSFDGKIYMYGGRCQDGTVSKSMYTYEPSTDTWLEHKYRFPLNEKPALNSLLGRIYAADPFIGEMSYYTCSDHRDTWWGFVTRERHLVPFQSLHAVFLDDSVFFLNGRLQSGFNINAAQNGSNHNKCTQVTINKNRSMSGRPIRQPDYPEGWTPCIATGFCLPWHIVRQAKPV